MNKRVTVTLDEDLAVWVQQASADINRSQSEVIRISLHEFMSANPNRFSRSDKARSKSEVVWLKGNK